MIIKYILLFLNIKNIGNIIKYISDLLYKWQKYYCTNKIFFGCTNKKIEAMKDYSKSQEYSVYKFLRSFRNNNSLPT